MHWGGSCLFVRVVRRESWSTSIPPHGPGRYSAQRAMRGRQSERFTTRATEMAEQLDTNDLVTLEDMATCSMYEMAALVEVLER